MATTREHIEHLRKTWFSIGGDVNPLASMLDQAVKYLSTELYTKDIHFLMELIQNAEDNEYPDGVDPSLEFVLTYRDITATGAPATLLLFNNEKGFSAKNIESICNVGNSTKKGERKSGYIGEKGIGFKSVFLITARPYIFSNGYQIRFNEEPCLLCGNVNKFGVKIKIVTRKEKNTKIFILVRQCLRPVWRRLSISL